MRLQNLWKQSRPRDESGAEVIEFAVSSMVFFAFTLGLMYAGYLFFMYQTAAEAARDGARWASVRGTNCNTTITGCPLSATPSNDVQTYVQNDIPGASNMTVTTNWCIPASGQCTYPGTGTWGTNNIGQGDFVRVTVSYTIASVPFIKSSGVTLTSSAQHVIW